MTTALIADDHAIMCEVLTTLLTSRPGFAQVITVSSFPDAAALAETPGISLALFTLSLPRR